MLYINLGVDVKIMDNEEKEINDNQAIGNNLEEANYNNGKKVIK